MEIKILDRSSFASEFERCCREYSILRIACAWCGDPSHILPYSYLTSNDDLQIEIIIGVSFNQTHPDAIKYFIDNGIHVKIFDPSENLFHPKIYLFKKNNKHAIFVGSSNFTYSGFYSNTEVNILIEGNISKEISQIENYFKRWESDKCSFIPDEKWLSEYRKNYKKQRDIERKSKIRTPQDNEESISSSSWLMQATWPLYYQKVKDGLADKERDEFGYSAVLDAAKENLSLPWDETIFEKIENRRIIGGMGKYGWLGHVAASGAFRQFMANGTLSKKRKMVRAINAICELSTPIDTDELSHQLKILESIGPTIKVWSRIITILRPDIFCTVASPSVRENLSKTLEIPKSHFETIEGYIKLIKLVHACPWYNSRKPARKNEIHIWERRAAFMDAIFY